jgi:hypothetical protein
LSGQLPGIVAEHGLGMAVDLSDAAIVIHPQQGGLNDRSGQVRPIALNNEFFHSAGASSGEAGSGVCRKPVILLFFYRFCHDSFIILTI